MKDQKYVYHASNIKGLKKLEPRESTHQKSWVYATKTEAASAMFLGENFDFICQTGLENGKPQIFEQLQGALELAYKNKSGVIYKLPAITFEEGKTSWTGEVVSEVGVPILEELDIKDALMYLEALEKKREIIIYRYPNKPKNYPTDKSDIIERGVNWTIKFGEKILDKVKMYHPDVLKQIINALKEKGFKPKEERWIEAFES